MKSITRGSRMQRLVFASLQRERGRDLEPPAGKVGAWGIVTAFVCLLGAVTMFFLIYVAMP
jgi:hypothetical protein